MQDNSKAEEITALPGNANKLPEKRRVSRDSVRTC